MTSSGQIPSSSLVALLLALALSTGWALAQAAASGVRDGQTNYVSIEPAFVVNILDGSNLRFMQVSVDVVSMDRQAIEAMQHHQAPIRHELLMLSHRKLGEVMGPQQRELLRQQALTRIQDTLLKYADIKPGETLKDRQGNSYPAGVQDVLFTSFVIQ